MNMPTNAISQKTIASPTLLPRLKVVDKNLPPTVGADITIDTGSEASNTASSLSLTFDKDEVIEDQKKEIDELKIKCDALTQLVSVKTGENVDTIGQTLDENRHLKKIAC